MTPGEEQIILKFMQSSIEKINRALANIYATQQVLIKRGIVSKGELVAEINDALALPERKVGILALDEMVQSFNESLQKEKI